MKALCLPLGCTVVLALTSCTLSYDLGVTQSTPPSEVATVTLSNAFYLRALDGQEFHSKFNMSTNGKTILHLSPGLHTFSFTYDPAQGWYTRDVTTLSKTLVGGRYYLINSALDRQYVGTPRIMNFSIDDVTGLTSK